jgi:lysophospholipase L1-like esterase
VTRVRALASNVLASAGIAVLLLLVLEGGCRAALRARTGSWPETRAVAYTKFVEKIGRAYRLHPFLVVAGRPDATLEAAGKVVHFNARGQRATNVRDLPLPKPPGVFRIVCTGGSSTFDLLAPDDASTWPARLGGLLAPRADVANAGFPGWTTIESLVSLEIRDVDLVPDLVVVFAGVNDLQPAGHVPFTADYTLGHADILPRVTGVVPVPVRAVSRSVFLEFLLGRLRPRAAAAVEGFAPAWNWAGGPRQDDVPPAAVAAFERNVRSTVAVARAHGARVVLVPQTLQIRAGSEARDREWIEAWCPGLTADGARRGLARYAEALRRIAAPPDVLLLEAYAGEAPAGDFDDACHFSPVGSDRFARLLAAFLTSPAGPLAPR